MPRLTATAPVLLVRDVVASANYFRDRCGFAYDRFYHDPPSFVILRRDGQHLMLAKLPAGVAPTPHWYVVDKMWNAYFWVDDADGLCAQMRSAGATIDYGPCTQPYGVREFGIQDPDGHDIGFGQVLKA
ncbi:MAG TPA: VOC family protein, partial [Humisphaera sp.]